ncbi:MAG: hypothetical protein E7062_07990 [Spirochaetaceae bacterium]|nr:hypothetical protein [Spirochaetaceae bacterium]
MKKLLVLVGILAAFSLMGCPKDPKDPVNPPASDPVDTPTEVVIFDPATYTAEGVEIVDLDGEKFAKVVVDGYSSTIKLPEVLKDLEIASVTGKVKVEKGDASPIQWSVQFMNEAADKQAAAFGGMKDFDVVKEYTSKWGTDFSYTDYSTGSATAAYGVNECAGIQVYAQDSNYQAVVGAIMYVGKITGK